MSAGKEYEPDLTSGAIHNLCMRYETKQPKSILRNAEQKKYNIRLSNFMQSKSRKRGVNSAYGEPTLSVIVKL
jgi:hypothetical protein